MNSFPLPVQKYLKKYSSSKWKVAQQPHFKFNNIVVIPALAEFENIIALLKSLSDNDKQYFSDTLILFVINNTKSASDSIKLNNKQSIDFLSNLSLKENRESLINSLISPELQIAFIDVSTTGNEMDEKNGGVGLARKIGMDLALRYFNYENSSKKILICLDADCTVSSNYLTTIIDSFNNYSYNSAVVIYEHSINAENEYTAAIICYELYLRYYLLGITFAGSPYAFHTIGSTMICDFESYIKIGGMNKLKAAEDFYFLEKLSKITEVKTINNAIVYPSSRPSLRVPFGTGQRVNRFAKQIRDEYLLYDPNSFLILKKWLQLLNELNETNIKQILRSSELISKHLFNFLILNGFEKFWNKITSQSLSKEQIIKQKKYWFDAFKTLKLIHYLRDYEFPLINMFTAIDNLLSLSADIRIIERNGIPVPNLDIQKEYLLLLRKIQNN